jgi:hypothetical protein
MDAQGADKPRLERDPAPFLVAGSALAVVSIPLAGAAGPPYLSLESLSPWLVVFAIGLFAALFSVPFAIHRRLGGRLEADARWERALLLWGAVALVALALGLALGLAGSFAGESLAGSLGLVILAEAAMVIATLLAWLVSG